MIAAIRHMEFVMVRPWTDVKGWPDEEIQDLFEYISDLFEESYQQTKYFRQVVNPTQDNNLERLSQSYPQIFRIDNASVSDIV